MKKYLLLLLLFFIPNIAEAASRFAICSTTCTWDNSSTAMWSASSGGATGASAPTSADDVVLDANTCVGGTTCTITTFAGTISAQTITWGACTASTTGCIIAANTNNTNFTLGGNIGATIFNGSGTGTRKWVAGTGTYALTQSNAFNNFFSMATTTNDQGSVFSGATWTFSGTTSSNARSVAGNGFSFGPTTFNANTSGGSVSITGANTFSSLTVNGPLYLSFSNGSTQTITGTLTLTGTSSSAVAYIASNSPDAKATVSIGSASTGTWAAVRSLTLSGAAAITISNCFDLGFNTLNSSTCNGPTGGGGGGRIIGG